MFNEISRETVSCENITSLTHSELASYYNELVIQLKVSETFLLNHTEREIQEEHRIETEEKIQQIIDLLDEEILPLLAFVVSSYIKIIACIAIEECAFYVQLNATTKDANCSDTEEIANNIILVYSDCAAVQTANIYLAQTALDLYRILTNILEFHYTGNDGIENEMDLTVYNDMQWCILQ